MKKHSYGLFLKKNMYSKIQKVEGSELYRQKFMKFCILELKDIYQKVTSKK
jgi:hypothetical protein